MYSEELGDIIYELFNSISQVMSVSLRSSKQPPSTSPLFVHFIFLGLWSSKQPPSTFRLFVHFMFLGLWSSKQPPSTSPLFVHFMSSVCDQGNSLLPHFVCLYILCPSVCDQVNNLLPHLLCLYILCPSVCDKVNNLKVYFVCPLCTLYLICVFYMAVHIIKTTSTYKGLFVQLVLTHCLTWICFFNNIQFIH